MNAIRLWWTCALLGCLQACSSVPAEPEPRPTGFGALEVTVIGLPSDDGQVLINLFLGPDGFPDQPKRAYAAVVRAPENGSATVRFDRVPAGPFAVSAFHDADLDRELDQDLLGIPTEAWGVSRDASGLMGPPAYEDARLELRDGEELQVEVETG